MKYILKLTFGLLLGIGMLAACSDDSDNKSVEFSLDKEDITVGNNGGAEQLAVTADGKWTTSVDASWVKVTPANGVGSGECTIQIDSTVISDRRKATIRIMAEGQAPKKVTINQLGYKKGIYLDQQDTIIESSGKLEERVLTIKVTTNVKFEKVTAKDATETNEVVWLEYEEKDFDLDYGDRPRTIQLRFKWANNPQEKERVAKVVFTPANNIAIEKTVLTVHQKAAPPITDDRAGDSLALLAISQMMNTIFELWDSSENMQYWTGVTLWERTDKEVKDNPKMLGRVRSVLFSFADTKESIPYQVSKLTYVESLSFYSNVNHALKDIDLDCAPLLKLTYLKKLKIGSYGLRTVKSNFKILGDRLVSLDLSGNHFNKLPDDLTPTNFPKLKTFKFGSQRRWDTIKDLENDPRKDNIGFKINTSDENFTRLLKWNALDTLNLQYAFIEGTLPASIDGISLYTKEEVEQSTGDNKLSRKLIGQPKVLPNTLFFALNLNYLTGDIPDWLRYHPHFSEWNPLVLFFEQEIGFNSVGDETGFTNKETDLEYYYKEYPHKRPNFEIE